MNKKELRFLKAAESGDWRTIMKLVNGIFGFNKLENLNIKNEKDKSALLYAVEKDNFKICELLIQNGADINTKDKDGKTPLIVASEKGSYELANLLVKYGADIDSRSSNGFNALVWASYVSKEICSLLIDKGSDVNVSSVIGVTPLMGAIIGRKIEICKFLIDKGANVNAINKEGYTPLLIAVERDLKDIVELLICNGANVNYKRYNKISPLLIAAQEYLNDIFKILVLNGAKLDVLDEKGKNFFMSDFNKQDIRKSSLAIENWDYLVDIDGNTYETLKIGKQIWMAENYKATHNNDGSYILNHKSYIKHKNLSNIGCLYDYGAITNYHFAPSGWMVPTLKEWKELKDFLIAQGFNWDSSKDVDKLGKALASTFGWTNSDELGTIGNNQTENNRTGFNGIPYEFSKDDVHFNVCSWWINQPVNPSYAWLASLKHWESRLNLHDNCPMSNYKAIRLVKYIK